MDIVLLLLGIGLAVYGAHFLVDGGSVIAKHYNIPNLVIGSRSVSFLYVPDLVQFEFRQGSEPVDNIKPI
jgi:cation:H+ antiporter